MHALRELPLSLLPTFLVPLIIASHVLIFAPAGASGNQFAVINTNAFTASVGRPNNDDGSKPIDNVILVNGWLYGMTTEGGANGQGTVFKVSPIPSRSPTPVPRPTPPH